MIFLPIRSAVSAIDRAQPREHWIDVDRSTAQMTLYIDTRPQVSYSSRIGEVTSADGFHSLVRDEIGKTFSTQNDFTKVCVRMSDTDARTPFAEPGMRI